MEIPWKANSNLAPPCTPAAIHPRPLEADRVARIRRFAGAADRRHSFTLYLSSFNLRTTIRLLARYSFSQSLAQRLVSVRQPSLSLSLRFSLTPAYSIILALFVTRVYTCSILATSSLSYASVLHLVLVVCLVGSIYLLFRSLAFFFRLFDLPIFISLLFGVVALSRNHIENFLIERVKGI